MKTLEPVGDISLFRKHNKHTCIPSLLPLFPFDILLTLSFPYLQLLFHPPLSIFLHTSLTISPPIPSSPSRPRFGLLLINPRGSCSASSVCLGAWEKIGHKQHSKQTTCFLLRSRVVKCVYGNRSGQPCSRIRIDRMDSGRKITDQHSSFPQHTGLCIGICRNQAW